MTFCVHLVHFVPVLVSGNPASDLVVSNGVFDVGEVVGAAHRLLRRRGRHEVQRRAPARRPVAASAPGTDLMNQFRPEFTDKSLIGVKDKCINLA
jgi:hypothetical protein